VFIWPMYAALSESWEETMKLTLPPVTLFEGTPDSVSIAFHHVQHPSVLPASGPGWVAAMEEFGGMSYSGLSQGTF
jgi:hypothetical protein